MTKAPAIMRLSQFDPKTLEQKQFDAIRGTMRITLPNGVEWDLSIDDYTGDLKVMYSGVVKTICIIPHVSNVITLRTLE